MSAHPRKQDYPNEGTIKVPSRGKQKKSSRKEYRDEKRGFTSLRSHGHKQKKVRREGCYSPVIQRKS